MSTATYTTLLEASELELQGSLQRLSVAKQELADFLAENDAALNGVAVSSALRESLKRQHAALLLELDESERRYRQSFEQVLKERRMPVPR